MASAEEPSSNSSVAIAGSSASNGDTAERINYKENDHADDLHLWQGAALLTADCLGTGILALPANLIILGRALGITFLILNLPINLYAGTILSNSAGMVEAEHADEAAAASGGVVPQEEPNAEENSNSAKTGIASSTKRKNGKQATYDSIKNETVEDDDVFHDELRSSSTLASNQRNIASAQNYDTATFDFIGMTDALFADQHYATRIVMSIYYCNIFLLLGDYILVMSHAVAALMGDNICIPTAGIIASTLMFSVSQLRTMAKLGRTISLLSLAALFVVVVQCLVALSGSNDDDKNDATSKAMDAMVTAKEEGLIPKFSALASIGFATGSQKLFLNIRHEMKHRSDAPKALAISLTFYVSVYVFICFMAGPNPPSFLFDAIAPGWNRRLGGLLLWIHVVVSYAINSQAICSSMDRIYFQNRFASLKDRPALRWMLLTFGMSVSSYLVANAIPFFKDLVSLIGALTSIPLTLTMPAIFYRQATRSDTSYTKAWWWPNCSYSYALLVFSVVFTAVGLVGALSEIELDWASHGPPFSCH